ncbi:MAG: hypothetical protein H0U95_05510 [Bacteroidetes bacterium]|nr:hypothetical protein [Bacteroidota bacterium]
MKQTLKKIIKPFYFAAMDSVFFLPRLFSYYKKQQLTETQEQFAEELSFFKTPENLKADGILLVQFIKDYEYTIKFAAAAKTYAQKNNLNVSFYDVSWTRWIGWGNKFDHIFNRYVTSSNEKLHRAFGGKLIFRNEDKFHDQSFIQQQLQKIQKQIIKAEDILTIKFENILVGDLIYDTYLRYFSQPTIERINADILKVIEIGLNIFYNFEKLLKEQKIKALFNSYTTYIEHGIPARICLQKGIKVFTFGSYSYIIQEATLNFPYHAIDHSKINPERKISALDLEASKTLFTSRFSGVIDEATRYMKVSAFSEKPISQELIAKFKSSKRNVVIYTHDFYDSPHINRCLLFPDLYLFLKQTLDVLVNSSDTNFYIKTHPNSYGDCKERTIALVNNYGLKHFHILDDSTSNIHIINLKPDLIVTARGTVGIEMAHFKIPVVALYDNQYINFKFVHSCRDLNTFFSIIKGEQQPVIDYDIESIYSFYFQTFMEKFPGKDNAILKLTTKDGQSFNDEYLKNILNNGFSKWKNDLFLYFREALKQLQK